MIQKHLIFQNQLITKINPNNFHFYLGRKHQPFQQEAKKYKQIFKWIAVLT